MKLFTIGFTKKNARNFFSLLRDSNARVVLDVRLNRTSQLAGFAKSDDLEFFLAEICGMGYAVESLLAPTDSMLRSYRSKAVPWAAYEDSYRGLLTERAVERNIPRESLDGACLLCSEHEPRFCHRRLAAEYLGERWGEVEIVHLV